MDDLRALVGASVKRLRVERRLTQAQLAEQVGRSVDMISRLERGDAAPSFDTLAALSSVLVVEPAELFGGRPLKDGIWHSHARALLNRTSHQTADELGWTLKLLDHLDRKPAS